MIVYAVDCSIHAVLHECNFTDDMTHLQKVEPYPRSFSQPKPRIKMRGVGDAASMRKRHQTGKIMLLLLSNLVFNINQFHACSIDSVARLKPCNFSFP